MRQTRQGGSSLVFIIIGVLLAALLVGGVYVLRQQTAQKPAPAPQSQEKPTPAVSETQKDKKKEEKSANETASPQKETSKEESSTQSTPTASAAELPQTGGTETIGMMLSLAVSSGVIVAYIRSRRAAHLAF